MKEFFLTAITKPPEVIVNKFQELYKHNVLFSENDSIFCLIVVQHNRLCLQHQGKSWKYNKVRRKILSNTRDCTYCKPPGLDQSCLNNYQTLEDDDLMSCNYSCYHLELMVMEFSDNRIVEYNKDLPVEFT